MSSNIRSTNHTKCDPRFILPYSNGKGLSSSKNNWEKLSITYMKKQNGKCISVLDNMSEIELEEIKSRYS
jgi:hypothetical protein